MLMIRLLTVLLLFPVPAFAQAVCSDRDTFLAHLDKGYSEAPVAMGLASNGSILEVLASGKGTWTILISMPDGMSCVVASGEAWETVKPKGDSS